jgi:hypothetical protein
MEQVMDLLQNKLDRLSSEQRREVEDFVDFLLFRSDNQPAVPRQTSPVPPALATAPPLLENTPVLPAQDPDPSLSSPPSFRDEPSPSPVVSTSEPETVREIQTRDDWLTHDYLDYGKLDQQPSPATEAVKKVKRKLIQREEHDKTHQLLEWID